MIFRVLGWAVDRTSQAAATSRANSFDVGAMERQLDRDEPRRREAMRAGGYEEHEIDFVIRHPFAWESVHDAVVARNANTVATAAATPGGMPPAPTTMPPMTIPSQNENDDRRRGRIRELASLLQRTGEEDRELAMLATVEDRRFPR